MGGVIGAPSRPACANARLTADIMNPDTKTKPSEVAVAVRTLLRAEADALRSRGFDSISLFGSVVRGDAGPESDIDILYAFAPGRASLDAVLDLKSALEIATGMSVHLVSRRHLNPFLREQVLSEAEQVIK